MLFASIIQSYVEAATTWATCERMNIAIHPIRAAATYSVNIFWTGCMLSHSTLKKYLEYLPYTLNETQCIGSSDFHRRGGFSFHTPHSGLACLISVCLLWYTKVHHIHNLKRFSSSFWTRSSLLTTLFISIHESNTQSIETLALFWKMWALFKGG